MNLPATAVLMGGTSPEREVSLASGRNVAGALKEGGVPGVVEVEILPGGNWRAGSFPPGSPSSVLERLLAEGVGCFFLALHGPGGEDGSIQGFLEVLGIPYTGSDVSSSALAMSKTASRALFLEEGLPVAPGKSFRDPDPGAVRKAAEEICGYPCFLKEEASGSSLGVYRISDSRELEEALSRFSKNPRPLVVERAVPGLEATVAVLGNRGGPLRAFPPVEIRTRKEFFDYQAKYDPQWTEEICPPRSLSPSEQERLQELALRVHRILGCDGASRTDFILGPEGPVVLECNTIPGLTRESLLPKAAAAGGLSFPQLAVRMVELALERSSCRADSPGPGES